MKVKELIKILETYNPELEVFLSKTEIVDNVVRPLIDVDQFGYREEDGHLEFGLYYLPSDLKAQGYTQEDVINDNLGIVLFPADTPSLTKLKVTSVTKSKPIINLEDAFEGNDYE